MYFLSINYYMRYCNARDELFPLRKNGLSRDCAGSGAKIRILFYHNCNFHQQYDDFAKKKKKIIDAVKHRQIFSVVCDGPASIWTNPITFGIHHGILILGLLFYEGQRSQTGLLSKNVSMMGREPWNHRKHTWWEILIDTMYCGAQSGKMSQKTFFSLVILTALLR